MSSGLREFANRRRIISTYLIMIAVLLVASSTALSQELEERLHTDWAIMHYEVIPQNPAAGEEAILRAKIDITSIIEPLPQVVEVMLKIDEKRHEMFLYDL